MGDPSTEKARTDPGAADRLDSWKEIAAYLNRDVTTAQRWEKREGMPVHRHVHDKVGSVYASRAELDAWVHSRNLPGTCPSEPSPDTPHDAAPDFATARSRPYRKPVLITVVAAVLFVVAALVWSRSRDYFWNNPLADARFTTLTDFDGTAEAAAISRDGQLVAFLSDRSGQMDVWITQVGSGQFHNLTNGAFPELVNPAVRTLGFSPDGSLVTFWVRKPNERGGGIGTWAVPVLGGQPKPYLEDAAEYHWSRDASMLVFHTPVPGDPLYLAHGIQGPSGPPIFTSPAGLHSHFPLFSPDNQFIYFVQGTPPGKLDIWRIPSSGGSAERITSHNSRVSHPVFIDQKTLLYLADDHDGSGPWLYTLDVNRRISHRVSTGPDRYTSLAASADGKRLVATHASPKSTLWKVSITDSTNTPFAGTQIALVTNAGSSPRLGPGYLLYVSATGKGESIFKLTNGESAELWSADGAQIIGAPAIAPDGQIAFSARLNGQSLLYVMNGDGTNAHVLTNKLDLQGDPAWLGQAILSGANNHGFPHLFRIPVDGQKTASFVNDYSVTPVVSPDGKFVIYSGPDVGTHFSLKAITSDGSPNFVPPLSLSRGARHLAFLPGKKALVFLRGDAQHRDVWLLDLQTGAEKQLTNTPADFDIRDFDISPDGRELVLERVRDHSDVVLVDLPRR